MLWMNWGRHDARAGGPDMAYSVEDDTYIALYGVWQDPADDDANVAWADRPDAGDGAAWRPASSSPTRTSAERPARFVSDENMARLDELRAAHDPDGLFHPWMGRL